MKLEQEHISQIKGKFAAMASKDDLLTLLNFVKPFIYGEKTIPFKIKQVTYYYNSNVATNRYSSFTIKKKSGSTRTIHAPAKGLKAIQRCLNVIFQSIYKPHDAAFGFLNEKSIVDNARIHASSYYVFNIDLKDFFPSIDQARVWKCLQLQPFNLNDKTDKNDTPSNRLMLANIIAALCCTEMEVERMTAEGNWVKVKKNVLPQGAPTSPILTNVICQKLDFLFTGVAKRFGLRYSRYADDITFSSLHNVYQKDSYFNKEIYRIVHQQGFHIKESKVRLQKSGYRQEVTGLVVNDQVNVKRRYIKELRKWLYMWETYGYEKAYSFFLSDYIRSKTNAPITLPGMANVIKGKLNYLSMVKGIKNDLLIKLQNRLNKLEAELNPINKIFDVWEAEGIEKAMEKYYAEFLKT